VGVYDGPMWWLAWIIGAQSALAVDRVVPDEHDSVEDAWQAAASGDTIVVRKGRWDGGELSGTPGREVTIRGEPGAVLVYAAVDGAERDSVLEVAGDNVVRVESLTIDGEGGRRGFGLFDEASLTLVDVEVVGGRGLGGAGNAIDEAQLTIQGGHLTSSTSTSGGGGLRVAALASALLTDVRVDANVGGDGGGVLCTGDSTCTLVRVEVQDNQGTGAGGGLAVTERAEAVVVDSVVCGNLGDDGGGAYVGIDARLTSEGTVYQGNQGAQGGAVFAQGQVQLLDDTFVLNEADRSAVVWAAGGVAELGHAIVAHNTGGVGDAPVVGVAAWLGPVLWWNNEPEGEVRPDDVQGDPGFHTPPTSDCGGDLRVPASGLAAQAGDPAVDGILGAGEAFDLDGDGYGDDDCDDADPAVNPGAQEVCNGLDDDCDQLVDGADDSLTASLYYVDDDGDGVGAGDGVAACGLGPTLSEVAGDCDDSDPTISPLADEVCGDGVDQDCDGDDRPCTTGSPTDPLGPGDTGLAGSADAAEGLSPACGCRSGGRGGVAGAWGALLAMLTVLTARRRRGPGGACGV